MSARASEQACTDVEPLLHAACDGELADDERTLVHEHVAGCPTCLARMDAIRGLKATLREVGRTTEMPDDVMAALRASLAAEPAPRVVSVPRIAMAAGLLLALVGAAGLALGTQHQPAVVHPDVIASVVERHTLDVPVDVASPDPTSVAAFLVPRVGHDVRVPLLDRAGYGLYGGRIVDVHERRASQLEYRGGLGQRVSLVAVPDEDGKLAEHLHLAGGAVSMVHGGHNVRVWSARGSVHALVGDLDAADLERLSQAIER